jgi:hypothetical protein
VGEITVSSDENRNYSCYYDVLLSISLSVFRSGNGSLCLAKVQVAPCLIPHPRNSITCLGIRPTLFRK